MSADDQQDYRLDVLRAAGHDEAADLLAKLPKQSTAASPEEALPPVEEDASAAVARLAALPPEQQQAAVDQAMGQKLLEQLKAQTNFGRGVSF